MFFPSDFFMFVTCTHEKIPNLALYVLAFPHNGGQRFPCARENSSMSLDGDGGMGANFMWIRDAVFRLKLLCGQGLKLRRRRLWSISGGAEREGRPWHKVVGFYSLEESVVFFFCFLTKLARWMMTWPQLSATVTGFGLKMATNRLGQIVMNFDAPACRSWNNRKSERI